MWKLMQKYIVKNCPVTNWWGRTNGHSTNSTIGFPSSSYPLQIGISRYATLQSRPIPLRIARLWMRLSLVSFLSWCRTGTIWVLACHNAIYKAMQNSPATELIEDSLRDSTINACHKIKKQCRHNNLIYCHNCSYVHTCICKQAALPIASPISRACWTVAFPVPIPEASLSQIWKVSIEGSDKHVRYIKSRF